MPTSSSGALTEITVETLGHVLAHNDGSTQCIDVREASELELAALPGFLHLPLSQFSDWSSKIHDLLDAQTRTLVLCHHGMRSAQMCGWLMQQGFTQVENIAGGIDAYAIRVDPSVPRY